MSSRARKVVAPMSTRALELVVVMSSRARELVAVMSSRARELVAVMSSRALELVAPMSSRARELVAVMSSRARELVAVMRIRGADEHPRSQIRAALGARAFAVLSISAIACASQAPSDPRAQEARAVSEAKTATSAAADEATRHAQPGDELPWFLADTINPAESGQPAIDLRKHFGSAPQDPRAALVLSFGRSDCVPCKKELPELARLDAHYRAQGVLFAVVILDEDDEGRADMRRWLVDEAKLPLPAVDDRAQILSRRFDVRAIPLLVLADRRGRITWRREGYEESTLAELEQRLEALIRAAP